MPRHPVTTRAFRPPRPRPTSERAASSCSSLAHAIRTCCSHDPHTRARRELHTTETSKVIGHDVPRRRAVDLGEARPAGCLVAPGGLAGATSHADVPNAPADLLRRGDRVGQPTQPNHVAALTIVWIGVEELVGGFFHH